MAPPMIHRLGLTLVLLLACLGSAPLGSMEQASEGTPGQIASRRSTQPVAGAGTVRPDRQCVARCQRGLPGPSSFHFPLPTAGLSWDDSESGVSHVRAGPVVRTLPPRNCERLPYDANAPPVLG